MRGVWGGGLRPGCEVVDEQNSLPGGAAEESPFHHVEAGRKHGVDQCGVAFLLVGAGRVVPATGRLVVDNCARIGGY